MGNKITIILNDKDMIKELIRDAETQIVIKDAVKNSIVKRLLNGEDMLNEDNMRKFISSLIYEKVNYWGEKTIKQEFRQIVYSTINEELKKYIKDEISSNVDLKSIEKKMNEYADECYDTLRNNAEYKLEKKLNSEVSRLVEGLKNRILEK